MVVAQVRDNEEEDDEEEAEEEMPGCRLLLVLGWDEEASLLRGMRVRLWRGQQDHWVTTATLLHRFSKTPRLQQRGTVRAF